MTRPTIQNADEFDPTIWRGLKLGVDQIGNVANQVIVAGHPSMLIITPTAAQNVLLPLESTAKGMLFIMANASAGAFALTLQTSLGAGLGFGGVVLAQNEAALLFCDGLAWRGITAAGVMTAP